MVTTTKKSTKKTKAKPPTSLPKKSRSKQTQATEELRRERDEALEQFAAASDILRMIARSPTDLQPVLDAIAESAAKLCDAADAVVWRVDGDVFRPVSHFGAVPTRVGRGQGVTRGTAVGRAILDRQTIHIEDLAEAAKTEFPGSEPFQKRTGTRTFLCTPMFREGVPIGLIAIRRTEVRPFTERQIKLLETFADQAVIAIENVRLFQELTESLEQQTATSEILGVIASSPTNIQPVLDTVAESAARLCEANDAVILRLDGDVLRMAGHYGAVPAIALGEQIVFSCRVVHGRAIIDRQPIHVHDIATEIDSEYLDSKILHELTGTRTILATPLLREGVPLGAIVIRRQEVRPFSEKQIALLKTFADQAVIAIENVRLFQELQARNRDLTEALEQQTATGEVLRVIASSPTDLQPVLDTLLANAVKLSGATKGHIRQYDGEFLRYVSHYNESPEVVDALNQLPQRPRPESMSTRALLEKKTVHVLDAQVEPNFRSPAAQAQARTMICVPLLREESGIGTITIWRDFVEPFTERQIELLKTFADQAVIAIENVRLFQELTEALERQTATSEILGVIASSPTDIQPVLNTVAANAARLCDATDAQIRLVEGDGTRLVASFGTVPAPEFITSSARNPAGRAILQRQTIQIDDLRAAVENEFPENADIIKRTGTRTFLSTPMLREGTPIGLINIRRTEVRPFSDRQIKLLETFADQAVIAIENVRLFQELQARNRDLTEALEQQTATGEVLRVIASSPTELQPVLDTLLASAVKLSGAKQGHIRQSDGEFLRVVAHYNESPERIAVLQSNPLPLDPNIPGARAFLDRKPNHLIDARLHAADAQFIARQTVPTSSDSGVRTLLAVPLLREGTGIGTITIWRDIVEPFTERQIELVKTFADQAVIAIENVRLFQELTEALEQQTATSEILGVIASSPTNVQPVLEAVAESAARLCDAKDSVVYRVDGDILQRVAICGSIPIRSTPLPVSRGTTTGRAVVDRQTIHIHDIDAESEADFPDIDKTGIQGGSRARTRLAVPLLREGVALGAILVRRMEVRPFSDKQIKLLETFASQAVIAIENVRLFQELQARNRDLTEALEQQTATSEILRVISSSPTDLQPVMDAIAKNAARLCDASDALIYRTDSEVIQRVAVYGPMPLLSNVPPINRGSPTGRAILDRQTIHVNDMSAEVDTEFPDAKDLQRHAGTRTALATPLLREGVPIGVIFIRRTEVRPFSEKQIALLKTFADQAVIAIENVRLFQELQERNAELREALEHQTATAEVLGIISRSPTDVQPVLDAIVESAARVCGIDDVLLRLREGNALIPGLILVR